MHHKEIMQHRYKKTPGSNTLYVNDAEIWAKSCSADYYIDEPTDTHVVRNGVVLPLKVLPGYTDLGGGVCDENGNFITGHVRDNTVLDRWYNCRFSYPVSQEISSCNETVVYGGILINHFGHALTESLSRIWWLVENPDTSYKFVFIADSCVADVPFIDFFQMLGLDKEQIVLVKEPTRFESIIIPDQSHYLRVGFKEKSMTVYNAIRDSVTPVGFEKVYLTRTKYSRAGDTGKTLNEEYFERYYHAMGYEIISPEQLSIHDQVAVMAGAKKVVCTSGTLHHLILFCQDGIDITVLNRSADPVTNLLWINQARKARYTFIDVSTNPLPANNVAPCFLLMPTFYWKQYIGDKFDEPLEIDNVSKNDFIPEYIEQWVQSMSKIHPVTLKRFREFSLADVIIDLHKHYIGRDLDISIKEWLQVMLPSYMATELLYSRIIPLFNSLSHSNRKVIICGANGMFAESTLNIALMYGKSLDIYVCDRAIITDKIVYKDVTFKTATLTEFVELHPSTALICAKNKGKEIYEELSEMNIDGFKVYPVYDLNHSSWSDVQI